MRITSLAITAVTAVLLVLISPLAAVGQDAGAADDSTTQAVEAAKAWLATVDAGDYGKSWDDASAFFRGAITRENWEKAVAGAREPFGKVLSREVKSTTVATTLPGAPDGHYVVIEFTTSFEHKKEASERVTPTLEEDGVWRVGGYFVR